MYCSICIYIEYIYICVCLYLCALFLYIFFIQMRVCLKMKERNISSRLVSSRLVREIWKLLVNFYAAPKPLAPSPAPSPSPSPSSCLSAATPVSLLLPPAVSPVCHFGLAHCCEHCLSHGSNMKSIRDAKSCQSKSARETFSAFNKKFTFLFFSMARFTSLPLFLSLSLSLCQWRGWSGLRSACWPDWKQIKNKI